MMKSRTFFQTMGIGYTDALDPMLDDKLQWMARWDWGTNGFRDVREDAARAADRLSVSPSW